MSKQHQDLPGGKLPIPQPRSPQELDDKILAYARERAPQKNNSWIPRWTNGWATGLATASIIVIAVFLTETQQPAPSLHESIQSKLELRDSADSIRASSTAIPAPAAVTNVLSKKRVPRPLMYGEPMEQQSTGAIAREEMADREMASDIASDSTTVPNSAAGNAPPHAKERARLDAMQLDVLREHLAQLLQQGDDIQARDEFQTLRLECLDCDLPETLDLWLAE